MRAIAVAERIIRQIIRDKRTMVLIVIAPAFVLSLIYLIFQSEDKQYVIGVNQASEQVIANMQNQEEYSITIKQMDADQMEEAVKNGEVDGAANFKGDTVSIIVSGVDVSVAARVEQIIRLAKAEEVKQENEENLSKVKEQLSKLPQAEQFDQSQLNLPQITYQVQYACGKENSSLFDKFGTQVIGIVIFFFVFLVAGINFLTERTSGALERVLSTPIKRYEIIAGYIAGFSILAFIQSIIVTVFGVYVLGLKVEGSILLVLLINVLTAINALILGLLLSTVAHSEFQMMQFIPIVILPQIFLCGLFRVSGVIKTVSYFIPLQYTSHALTEVMQKGNGLSSIYKDVGVLVVMSSLLIILNIRLLRRQRDL